MEIPIERLKKGPKAVRSGGKSGFETTYLSQEVAQGMLDLAPINVMLADLEGTITYMNRQSSETLLSIENQLPVRVKDIVGNSYDVFHRNPAVQRKLLATDKNLPHKAIIQIGTERLELLATPNLRSKW